MAKGSILKKPPNSLGIHSVFVVERIPFRSYLFSSRREEQGGVAEAEHYLYSSAIELYWRKRYVKRLFGVVT